jgi:hypothetical protein
MNSYTVEVTTTIHMRFIVEALSAAEAEAKVRSSFVQNEPPGPLVSELSLNEVKVLPLK